MTAATSTKPQPPPTDPKVALQASVEAHAVRADWLIGLHNGHLELDDLLTFACTDEGRPLRRLRVAQVLASQPEWTMGKAAAAVERIRRTAPYRGKAKDVTVGWLIDGRSDGRRIAALSESLVTRQLPPGTTPWTDVIL